MTGAKRPHVVIYEPACSGHRLHYVGWIAAALMRDGRSRVTLITGEKNRDHPVLQMVRDTCGEALTIGMVSTPQESWPIGARRGGRLVNKISKEIEFLVSFRRAVSDLRKADKSISCLSLISINSCTSSVRSVSNWGTCRGRDRLAATIPFWRYGHSGARTAIFPRGKTALPSLLGGQSLRRIFSLDPFLVDYVRSQWLASAAKVESGQVVVLAYGTLSDRKAVDVLFRAMAAPSVPKTVIVLLAGSQLPELGPPMASPLVERLRRAERLIESNGYVTSLQEEQAFKAADIVWLGYRGHYGSSGVQVQAGVAGLPVLATDQGLVGRLTNDQGLGEAVPMEDPAAVATALARLAGNSGLRARYGANGKRYFTSHTVENFGETVACTIIAADAPD